MGYPGITSIEEAKEMGWLEEPYKSNNFLERYNLHQKYLEGEEGGERFIAKTGEMLPKYLKGARLRGAMLIGADLTGADLRFSDLTGAMLIGADLTGADLIGANITGVDLAGAVIDKAFLFQASTKDGIDFTNTRLNIGEKDPLSIEESKKIIITCMIVLKIPNAKGLGNYWEEYQKESAVEEEAAVQENKKAAGDNKSEAEIAPTLLAKGFKIVSNMPTKRQAQKIYDEPIIERDLQPWAPVLALGE